MCQAYLGSCSCHGFDCCSLKKKKEPLKNLLKSTLNLGTLNQNHWSFRKKKNLKCWNFRYPKSATNWHDWFLKNIFGWCFCKKETSLQNSAETTQLHTATAHHTATTPLNRKIPIVEIRNAKKLPRLSKKNTHILRVFFFIWFKCLKLDVFFFKVLPSLKLDGWNTSLSYWRGLFSGATLVSGRVHVLSKKRVFLISNLQLPTSSRTPQNTRTPPWPGTMSSTASMHRPAP